MRAERVLGSVDIWLAAAAVCPLLEHIHSRVHAEHYVNIVQVRSTVEEE